MRRSNHGNFVRLCGVNDGNAFMLEKLRDVFKTIEIRKIGA
jgi:hypothetical protein